MGQLRKHLKAVAAMNIATVHLDRGRVVDIGRHQFNITTLAENCVADKQRRGRAAVEIEKRLLRENSITHVVSIEDFGDGRPHALAEHSALMDEKLIREAFTFRSGDRVILKANPSEGWVEERGSVIDSSGYMMYLVQLDKEYLHKKSDDGIREVGADDLLPEKMPPN
jgi:hypothetical protein